MCQQCRIQSLDSTLVHDASGMQNSWGGLLEGHQRSLRLLTEEKDKRSPGTAPLSFSMARTSPSRFRFHTVVRTRWPMARSCKIEAASVLVPSKANGNGNQALETGKIRRSDSA